MISRCFSELTENAIQEFARRENGRKILTLMDYDNKQEAHQLVRQVKRRVTKIRPKAAGDGIFGRFSNLDKYRPEVAGDVISGVAEG